ncbi:MAG: hypothetical protein J2P46_07745 [Zavarzinella sp.]|nr:hypothetical protein [Zavarzinella sp.]
MTAITTDQLNPLLDQFEGEGPVLTCYADRAGADGFHPGWEGPLETQVAALRRVIREGRSARREFDRDLAAVRQAFEAPQPEARWRAVFSSHRRGFLHSVPLDTPVKPDLVSDRGPYLVPLLGAMLRRREYLAVHTDSHRGRLYTATPGAVRLLTGLDADVPKKQHSAGERWGLGQATIEHHRDEVIHHYQKGLIHHIERAWADRRYAGLLLLGSHPILEHVRKALPDRLAARVERETPAEWSDRPGEIESGIRELAARVFAQDEAQAIDAFSDRLTEHRAIATGPSGVLAALQSGRVGPHGHGCLILGPDPRETVGRCTRCHTLAPNVPAACPRCQAPCREASLWEELLLMALRHGITAHRTDDPDRLAPFGGLAAILPKSEPASPRPPARQPAGRA